MQHKMGKVEAHEGGGQQAPDTMRLPHARHHALASRFLPAGRQMAEP